MIQAHTDFTKNYYGVMLKKDMKQLFLFRFTLNL